MVRLQPLDLSSGHSDIPPTLERTGAWSTRTLRECPFCHGSIALRYADIPDRLGTTSSSFSLYECVACRAGLLNPAPTGDLSSFYPVNYLSGEADGRADPRGFDLERWYRYNQYAYDFRLFEQATGTSIGAVDSYVDLGCGSGERITYVSERGCPRVVGVDKFAFAKARAQHEAEIVKADLLDFAPSRRFRAVSLFHVLEHLEEPDPILAHIRDGILEPGGYLIIQVPNYGSLESRWFKERWFGLDLPRHYWHFNERAMRRLMATHGFDVSALYQRNAPLHPVSVVPSLFPEVDIQQIWVNREKGARYVAGMKLLWAALTILTIPVCIVENIFERASMLTVVATPR